ncbi:MAG TPA: DNA topoisomerase 3 [Kofleriaceae bacterium]
MQLVIAEKPSVARDLARVLGVPARGGQGVTAFEGTDYVVTWCIGHLVELVEPAEYDPAWKAWRLDRLPMLPDAFKLQPAKHAVAQLRGVAKLLKEKRFAAVINACDAGREGELIFRYVHDFAKSRLPVRRLWISSLTDDAIRRGMAALRPGSDLENLADAARSRSEADWLVGMNATRAITVRNRLLGGDSLASIGRVQTPTLAMLVEREREIREFVPKAYWEVRASLIAGPTRSADPDMPDVPGAAVRFAATWRDGALSRLGTRELADTVVARDTDEITAGRDAVVERVRASTQREAPPQLFDLTTLQRTANRRFGFSAQRTLELAQLLYERHKVLTYPRTDSRHLSADVAAELDGPLTALAGASDGPNPAAFARHADAVLAGTPPTKRALSRRFVDDSKVRDHHAIIPTATPVHLAQLDRDAARIYDLVARRFLGMFFPDAELAVTEVWIAVGELAAARKLREATDGDREAFVAHLPPMPDRYLARGRVRTLAGWQDVAGIDAKSATSRAAAPPRADGSRPGPDEESDDSGQLPMLVEGQRLHATFAPVAKQTKPPPRFSEATLLGAMETAGKRITDEALREAMKDTGLGTPATRASIIETLLRRDFIARDRKDLIATELGIALITSLPVASLASPELTGNWEARLAAVARGEDSRAAFMGDIARFVIDLIDAVRGSLPPGMASAPLPPRSAPPSSSSPPPRSAPPSRSAPASGTSFSASPPGAPAKAKKPRVKKEKPATASSLSTLPVSVERPRHVSIDPRRSAPTSHDPGRDERARPTTSPPPMHRPSLQSVTNPDISIAATEWLAEAIMRMAPDADGT